MSTATRLPLVLPVAGAVTVGLFVMMNGLIEVEEVVVPEVQDGPVIVLAEIPPDTETIIRTELEPLDPIDPPPPPPVLPSDPSPVDPTGEVVSYQPPPIGTPNISPTDGLAQIERNPQPVVRIEPTYPSREQMRGGEGQCTLVFDITVGGRTANIRATDCTSSAFERASLNAVANWRYNPQIEDGEPTLYRGATTVLFFRMSS
jgi:protein TonB